MSKIAQFTLEELEQLGLLSPLMLYDLGLRMDVEDFEHAMKLLNVIWVYPGEPGPDHPHALLTSGKHSNGYLKPGEVIKRLSGVTSLLAREAVRLIPDDLAESFDWVVGSDTSATALAAAIAEIAEVRHVVLQKDGDDQLWVPGQEPIAPGSRGLHAEELITTLGSAGKVRKAVRDGNPHLDEVLYVSCLPVLVDRSDPKDNLTEVEGSIVRSFVRYEMVNYDVPGGQVCPYCEAGSKALKVMDHQELFFGQLAV